VSRVSSLSGVAVMPSWNAGFEVIEDHAPRAVVAGAAAMAFVHDDEVEEVRRVCSKESGTTLVIGESLVDREIHLAALHDLARFDLVACVAEGREDAVLGLIDQDVSVGEIQNARAAILACSIPARRPKLPADLEGNSGLSGAGRHRDEYSCSALTIASITRLIAICW